MIATAFRVLVPSFFLWVSVLPAQDSTLAIPAADLPPSDTIQLNLDRSVSLSDTIPPDFFSIADNLGLHLYTVRLIARYRNIPDSIVLESLARADAQTGIRFTNAFMVVQALEMFCQGDSLWRDFFSDIERQLREPNILRFNFRDDQKWKSYALDELFYSTFFQELLLVMGNIGIAGARDGKQWLDGWPDPLRWKFREYRFEYMPEDAQVRVIGNGRVIFDTVVQETPGILRIQPLNPILPVGPADTVEPALPKPHF